MKARPDLSRRLGSFPALYVGNARLPLMLGVHTGFNVLDVFAFLL
jgi:hypothetical protein